MDFFKLTHVPLPNHSIWCYAKCLLEEPMAISFSFETTVALGQLHLVFVE
jgi:hypothetical protein